MLDMVKIARENERHRMLVAHRERCAAEARPDLGPYEVRALLHRVRSGLTSVGVAAFALGLDREQVQMYVWGKLVQ
jgi:hypothetical protein